MTVKWSSLRERLLMPPSLLRRSLIVQHNDATQHSLSSRSKCGRTSF